MGNKEHKGDFFAEEEGPISIEQYNREIEEAEKEIDNGTWISHEEVVRESAKWGKEES